MLTFETRLISKPVSRLTKEDLKILTSKQASDLSNFGRIEGLPVLPYLVWKKILSYLEPLEIFRIKNISQEFNQPALNLISDYIELFENRKNYIEEEMDRGIWMAPIPRNGWPLFRIGA